MTVGGGNARALRRVAKRRDDLAIATPFDITMIEPSYFLSKTQLLYYPGCSYGMQLRVPILLS